VTVAFAPTAVGPAAATLRVVGDAGTQDVALTGTGSATGAKLVVSPAAVDFGILSPGSAASRTATVTNAADVPMGIDGVGVVGAQVAAFAIDSDACGAHTVAPGASCAVALRFAPSSTGSYAAALRIAASGAASIDVALSGSAEVRAGGPPPGPLLFAPPKWGPPSWTVFKLTDLSGKHRQVRFKLHTSLTAHVRLTVIRRGRVIGALKRDVLLGSRRFRMRGLRTGRYLVKAKGRRMSAIRTAQASVTVTK
jgi:hypothetical protein